jgi:hypothetical protein
MFTRIKPSRARLVGGVRLAVLAGILVLAPLSGCESKVSVDNYNAIATGMTLPQVEAILGKGENVTPTGMSVSGAGIASSSSSKDDMYSWKESGAEITVTIRDGKVVAKGKVGL